MRKVTEFLEQGMNGNVEEGVCEIEGGEEFLLWDSLSDLCGVQHIEGGTMDVTRRERRDH